MSKVTSSYIAAPEDRRLKSATSETDRLVSRRHVDNFDTKDVAVDVNAAGDKNVGQHPPEDIVLTTRQYLVAWVVYASMGTGALLFWNAVLGSLFSFQSIIWPGSTSRIALIISIYCVVTLTTTSIVVVYKLSGAHFLLIGGAGMSLACILYPMVAQWLGAVGGLCALISISVLAGGSTALYQSSLFQLAATAPRNLGGAASVGFGVSGLFAFVVWLLMTKIIPDETIPQRQKALWITFSIHLCLIIGSTAIAWRLEKQWEKARKALKIPRSPGIETQSSSSMLVDADTPRGLKSLFWIAREPMLNLAFTFFITLFLFPALFPSRTTKIDSRVTLIVGVFQVGDFVGRYIPAFETWIPFLAVKPDKIKYFVLARIAFIPLIVCMVFVDLSKVSWMLELPFMISLMALFSISNGWIVTLCIVRVPQLFTKSSEKSLGATIGLVMLLAGIAAGALSANVWGSG